MCVLFVPKPAPQHQLTPNQESNNFYHFQPKMETKPRSLLGPLLRMKINSCGSEQSMGMKSLTFSWTCPLSLLKCINYKFREKFIVAHPPQRFVQLRRTEFKQKERFMSKTLLGCKIFAYFLDCESIIRGILGFFLCKGCF